MGAGLSLETKGMGTSNTVILAQSNSTYYWCVSGAGPISAVAVGPAPETCPGTPLPPPPTRRAGIHGETAQCDPSASRHRDPRGGRELSRRVRQSPSHPLREGLARTTGFGTGAGQTRQ